jgi:hypothetical protein
MAEHPITPAPELVKQWLADAVEKIGFESSLYLATRAAQWGSDQELEACCAFFDQDWADIETADALRAARRQQQSLKERALAAARIELDPTGRNGALIIRALEQLP